jgi:hypothetical protein
MLIRPAGRPPSNLTERLINLLNAERDALLLEAASSTFLRSRR